MSVSYTHLDVYKRQIDKQRHFFHALLLQRSKIFLMSLSYFCQNTDCRTKMCIRDRVKEFMRKKYFENIKENSYWLNILDNYYFYGDDDHSNYLKILESITPNDVKIFVKEFLSQNNRATVIMMPKE